MAANITGAAAPVTVQAFSGDYLVAEASEGSVMVSVYGGEGPAATVTTADVAVCAGTVHVVDQVLLPAPCGSVVDAIAKTPMLAGLLNATAVCASVSASPQPA